LDEARLNVVIGTCVQNGVIMGRNTNTIPGRCNVLLVAPPLVVNQAETDQIVEAIKKGLNAALG
jgi:taurine-pyruvate aminotransferase